MGFRERLKDERGISAVVAAVVLVGLFSAAVLSVDAGNLWRSRRGMVTATDTAALVGAQLAVGNTSAGTCPSTVQNAVVVKLAEQQPDATLDACTLNPSNAKSGYVTVDARRPVALRFGGVLNLGTQSVFSSTSVAYGYPTGGRGLRPIGVCIDNPHVKEWLDLKAILNDGDPTNDASAQSIYNALRGANIDHPIYSGAGVVHRIYFSRPNAQNCSGGDGAAGNWGWQDFDGGGNPDPQIRDWLLNGWDGEVGIHTAVPLCTAYDPADGCLNGTTGSRSNSISTELDYLVNSGIKFHIPIFDGATGPGNNAMFTVRAFVGLILRGYKVTGAESERYFDVEFFDARLSGSCCSSVPVDGIETGALATTICAVDHDAQTEASRCTPA